MDLAPRDGINILDHAKLHAMIACTGLIGSPIPVSVSRRSDAESGSSSGVACRQRRIGKVANPDHARGFRKYNSESSVSSDA